MVQAPITAVVIVMEMTDDQTLAVPLMATALLAFGASRETTSGERVRQRKRERHIQGCGVDLTRWESLQLV